MLSLRMVGTYEDDYDQEHSMVYLPGSGAYSIDTVTPVQPTAIISPPLINVHNEPNHSPPVPAPPSSSSPEEMSKIQEVGR